MKGLLKIASVVIFIGLWYGSACTSGQIMDATQTPAASPTRVAETITPEKIAATPTEKADATPTPKPERWAVLLPDDLAACRAINVFSTVNFDDLTLLKEELTILTEKENMAYSQSYADEFFTIDPGQIKFDFGDKPSESKRPNLIITSQFKPVFTSCSYLPFDGDTGLFVLGLKVRRAEFEESAIIHIAVDEEGFLKLYQDGGLDPTYYTLENAYSRIKNGQAFTATTAYVNGKGYSEADGPWSKSLELLYQQPVEGKNPLTTLITRFFSSGRGLEVGEIKGIQAEFQKVILPCFALSIHS